MCRYNGFLPQGDKGRRRSKFVLFKRAEANGVRRSRHYIVQSPQTSKAILDANQHSISYTLSRNQAVIVEYKEDADTDMFQVKFNPYICICLYICMYLCILPKVKQHFVIYIRCAKASTVETDSRKRQRKNTIAKW